MRFDSLQNHAQVENRPNIGISACLLGEPVRYNAGHCHSKFCTQVLSEWVRFTPFCPEVAAGFGTPRPTMRLSGHPQKPMLTFSDNGTKDLTHRLVGASKPFLDHVENLDGYILMKNSPSCGMERIKIYQPSGHPHQTRGQGVFTAELKKRCPYLPLEEEGRLNDPKLRENFMMRVYALYEFKKSVLSNTNNVSALINFHSQYKYLIMAHNPQLQKRLGQLLASQIDYELDDLKGRYLSQFMSGMSEPSTKNKHSNVLLHILGYLKKITSSQYRRNIEQVIENYRIDKVPLIVPIMLIKHHIDASPLKYINIERYLRPYPDSLGLRNLL